MDANDGVGPRMKWALLAAACMLILAAVGVMAVLRMQRKEQVLRSRVAAFRAGAVALEVAVRLQTGHQQTWSERLAAVIRFDPARADQYKLPWFVVVGAAILTGRLAVLLAFGIVGMWAWMLLPVVALGGSRAYYASVDGKRRALLLVQFPDALALVVRAVRVGIPVTEAMRAVSREASEPTRNEFNRLQGQIAIGAPLETALREMAKRNQMPEYNFFAAALALQAQTGGALTATLETLADIIRRRIAMKERGFALSSEARTSSLVLGALPLVTAGLLFVVSPAYIEVLFTTSTGNMVLGGAVLSLATGMGVMRVIIKKSLA